MSEAPVIFKRAVAALFVGVSVCASAAAQPVDTDTLLDRLRQPDLENWEAVEREIWERWSQSSSPTVTMLLERGRAAMAEQDWDAAIDHLTALVDHAPGFAEGYNARATAYFQAGLYGPALADIERTLALNPDHFGALMGLAMIFEQLDRPEDALAAYRAVAAIHPHRPNLEDAIGRLERRLGETTL